MPFRVKFRQQSHGFPVLAVIGVVEIPLEFQLNIVRGHAIIDSKRALTDGNISRVDLSAIVDE